MLQFAEFQNLVDQAQQPFGITVHHGVQLLLLRISLRFHHLLKRPDNQGERGAELVTDIRKEAHLGLGKLLLLAHFEPFDAEFVFLLHTQGEEPQ
ncbi:hypothetical protein SDC9_40476 [bioreactor metagenome]|uniref:Uncharacterized protein n=1 Tax=bioreactor metagenome TaxID=1076179 RepID=A0A644VVE0_9ZZZZ